MTKDPASDQSSPAAARPPRRHARVSPLLLRVLAVNLVAPMLLLTGFLYFGEYRNALIQSELDSLKRHAELIATAMAEGSVREMQGPDLNAETELLGQAVATHGMELTEARNVLRRSLQTLHVRVRVFDANGLMVIDSRELGGTSAPVEVLDLPPPSQRPDPLDRVQNMADDLWAWLDDERALPLYTEKPDQSAEDYVEVYQALDGEGQALLRRIEGRGKIFSAAVPVQYYKEVVGALMVTKGGTELDAALLKVRRTILELSAVTLGVTVLLSLYLARTMTGPLTRLAESAQSVRHGHGRHLVLPELERRADEIGALSYALNDMTTALWARMDAIERFAADVAHEIKNPLTSLRSAVETAVLVKDPAQQAKLMTIIKEDVDRLDRLISDISDASRLDAELSRAEVEPVDLTQLLKTLAEVHDRTGEARGVTVVLGETTGSPLIVEGIEGRLAQVVRNLLSNAVSFSPEGGTVTLSARQKDDAAIVTVEDQGPGMPPGVEMKLFERFYTERPEGEKFGTHSGLGLAISQQIVEAHDGEITAENIVDTDGAVTGARFTVTLPVAG